MKLHQNNIESIIQSLRRIFVNGYYADDTVRKLLQSNPKWGSRDRRFIAQAIYTVVRWWKRYLFIAETNLNDSICFEKVLSVYLYETYENEQLSSLPFPIDKSSYEEKVNEAFSIRAVSASIPEWLDEIGEAELGKEVWEQELLFLNKEADVFIRVNTLKANNNQVTSELKKEGVDVEAYGSLSETYRLKERKPLNRLASYLDGLYEVQDVGSQYIAHYLSPSENSHVIDACAGAGGKSLHLAALMRNKGRIISMDIEAPKLIELERRAKRAGVRIIDTKTIIDGTIDSLKSSADYLLLDVPCSGIGVLRRKPDDKWKLSKERIAELISIQQEILQNYSAMLKPGGIMVYATCSILPSENDKQIETFLLKKTNFILEKKQTIYPSQGGDGYFMARIRKL
jgi:16S rRNA (cytosine967-C5)-methyltransferase